MMPNVKQCIRRALGVNREAFQGHTTPGRNNGIGAVPAVRVIRGHA